jgi:hypothetical protein
MREKSNVKKILTIILCLGIAGIGAAYQILHTIEINKNKENQSIQTEQSMKQENSLLESYLSESEKSSNVQKESEELLNQVIEESKLEEVPTYEDVEDETADFYASEDWVDISNLEVLTMQVNNIDTFELKSQIKSYLDLSGYNIYLIQINESSVIKEDTGFQFESTLEDICLI